MVQQFNRYIVFFYIFRYDNIYICVLLYGSCSFSGSALHFVEYPSHILCLLFPLFISFIVYICIYINIDYLWHQVLQSEIIQFFFYFVPFLLFRSIISMYTSYYPPGSVLVYDDFSDSFVMIKQFSCWYMVISFVKQNCSTTTVMLVL